MSCLHESVYVRIVGVNGADFVMEKCALCFIKLRREWVPHSEIFRTGLTITDLPIVEDRRLDVPPCRRCGQRGTELHHFAPKELFDDHDLWPMDWLCQSCHVRWHQVMNRSATADLHAPI